MSRKNKKHKLHNTQIPTQEKRPLDPMPFLGHDTKVIHIEHIVNIANHAWRAKSKMMDEVSRELREDARRYHRHIEAILESLKSIGIQVEDKTGALYDAGMDLSVISFEPTPGLIKEEIKETIKPTIYFNNRSIQKGEVIVGIPTALVSNNNKETTNG